MFDIKSKQDGSVYKVYAVHYLSHNFTLFLVREGGEWQWTDAKQFEPEQY